MKTLNTESLLRDWKWVVGIVALLMALSFGLNYLSAGNDLAEQRAEMIEDGIPAASIDLPTTKAEAIDRTFGKLYDLMDLINLVALVAVAGLIGFYVLKVHYPKTLAKFGEELDEGFREMRPAERTRWKIGVWALIVFAIVHGRAKAEEELALDVSPKSIERIVYYEVGGRAYFEKFLTKPTVPAWQSTASGVTVLFGVDVGHMSKAQIAAAMEGIVPAHEIRLLQSVAGMQGRNAYYNGLPKVRHLRFTWDQAQAVFERDTLPRFTRLTAQAFRLERGRLHPHENGALVSLVFNRGASMSGSRRKEMRDIRDDIARGMAGYVPWHLRAMKKYWPSLRGLQIRRDGEADLFALGSKLRLAS